ncbi:MAG: hypothetical protein HQK61_11355 [Desulfamplus sp.]|nr:hypothetical protein [Desulfamplus sp.]
MAALAENYQSAQISEIGLRLRFEALREFTLDQISTAVTLLVKTRKNSFMPTTAEIVEAITGGGTLSIEQKAEIEAGKVIAHVRTYGRSRAPRFDDPVTGYLMEKKWSYLSWVARLEESELKWWEKDFVRSYVAHAAAERTGYFFPLQGRFKQLVDGIAHPLH